MEAFTTLTLIEKDPALFQPSTCKTLTILTVFEQLVGLDHVDILSRHKTRFNFGRLKKDDDSPYVLLLDNFCWENAGMYTADFLNLLDGNFVSTENRFEKRTSGALKGTIAITSNDEFNGEEMPYQDRCALRTRIDEVVVFPLTRNLPEVDHQPVEKLQEEAVGFSILSNAVFLAKNGPNAERAPRSFYADNQENVDCERDIYEMAGIFYIKEVLGFIEHQRLFLEHLPPKYYAPRQKKKL